MIPLSTRLLCCASLIQGDVICDIGTDHAYLPAYLLASGKASHIVATDVKQGPLNAAAVTLKKYHVAENATLILSDGFDKVPPSRITDVVIAGMGGETIRDILSAKSAAFVKKGVNLVLQPMTKAEILRGWLAENGFEIRRETAVKDTHIYTVLQVQYTGNVQTLSEAETYYGKLKPGDVMAKYYIAGVTERLDTRAAGLEASHREEDAQAVRRLIAEINQHFTAC
ncbi:MAG: class I SAM-dependent methyltransferase [Oscillospiraceae bacterium]|nr:class I SAM-dependent methyltransferase [Oscillospiraceae bacterium]